MRQVDRKRFYHTPSDTIKLNNGDELTLEQFNLFEPDYQKQDHHLAIEYIPGKHYRVWTKDGKQFTLEKYRWVEGDGYIERELEIRNTLSQRS